MQELNHIPQVRIRVWGRQEVLRLHLRTLTESRLSPRYSLCLHFAFNEEPRCWIGQTGDGENASADMVVVLSG